MRVLITGGAGFIGSHVTDLLLEAGHHVRILDNLFPQVHKNRNIPAYLNKGAEFRYGDVRDRSTVETALESMDAVTHLAAAVGVGQSMYQVSHYTSTNNFGTAVLLEALTCKPVSRLVVASSMSIYGEGLYRNEQEALVDSVERSREQLARQAWEPCESDGSGLYPEPTPEWKRPSLSSVYALSKFDQEQLCLLIGAAYRIPTIALRFFNVYGPRQALSNPYTGVLAIFASRLLNDKPPLIYEDGGQRRDFVHVSDVARACQLAVESTEAGNNVFNVGSGTIYTVREIAGQLAQALHKPIEAVISGQYRAGDIRHCYADISRARDLLGYAPQTEFNTAIIELAEWVSAQQAEDGVEAAHQELLVRGLAN